MNQIACRSALTVLLACAATTPAWADVTADLQTKLDSALRGSKSFVVTTTYPAQAYSSTLVVVAPDRTRMAIAVAANTTDIVTIGQTTYSSKNGAPFEKSPVAAPTEPRPASAGSVKVRALHADVIAGGVTYGAFDAAVPLGKVVTLTCTYDKKSYRLVRCANADVTQTYNSYDDPQNAVEAPKNAIDAPPTEAPKGTN